MIFVKFRVLLLLFALALPLAACGQTYSWDQKLVLEIETPEGTVSGYGITRVVAHWPADWLGGLSVSSVRTHGSAVVVKLPNNKYLFALLDGMPDATLVFREKGRTQKETARKLRNYERSKQLSPKEYPMLVMFEDISDPASVFEVRPNMLKHLIGEEYKLLEMRLEIGDFSNPEPEILRLLPWISTFGSHKLDGNRFETIYTENRFANSLSPYAFFAGEHR